MFILPDIAVQTTEELLQTVNDSIENLKFRIIQDCNTQCTAECEHRERCEIFRDSYELSEYLINNKDLLELVVNYPILNGKLIDIFDKLIPLLQFRIATSGDFRAKSRKEIQFLSQIEVDEGKIQAGLLYDWKGAANHILGNYEFAITCFNNALAFHTRNPNIYFRRGESKYKLALYSEAKQDFSFAIEINEQPDAEERLEDENLATSNLRLGNFKTAEEDFLKVLIIQPNHPDANCRLGEIYGKNRHSIDDLFTAIKYFQKSISSNEDHFEARFELALTYYHMGILIGYDTFSEYTEGARQRIHSDVNIGEAEHRAVVNYCNLGIKQVEWLIRHTEEDGYMIPGAKAQRLAQLFGLKGKLWKITGDNTLQTHESIDTGVMRKNAISTLESLENGRELKSSIEKLIDDIYNFKKLSEEIQKRKASEMVKEFNVLLAGTKNHRISDLRKISTAAGDFFASIGSFRVAEQFILKLKNSELRSGVRDSAEYCDALQEKYAKIRHGFRKEKINTQALMYYIESEKSFENALRIQANGELYLGHTIACLSISDLISKKDERYAEKALQSIRDGLDMEPENPELVNLLSRLMKQP